LSSRPPRGPSSATGRQVSRPKQRVSGRGSGGQWTGSSNWSPYGRRESIWPKILLVVAVVGVLLFGSILVADRFAGLGVADSGDDDGDIGAAGSPTATWVPSAVTGSSVTGSPVTGSPAAGTPTASPTPVDIGEVETAKDVAEGYVKVWSAGNYEQLYDLLSSTAKSKISKEDFVARYQGIAVEAGIVSVQAEITGGDDDAEIFPMRVEIESSRIGEFVDENQVPVIKEGDEYKVDWSPSLIFAGLGDGFVRWTPEVPQRGRILDRKGRELAKTGLVSRVGVIPGQIANEQELLQKLPPLLGMDAEQVKNRYQGGQADWFMPIKDYPENMDQALVDQLSTIPGVVIQKWPARVYPYKELTAHVVGYIGEVTAEELPELSKRGYASGDLIGRTGIESWAEQWLGGKRGGTLALVAPDGSQMRVLGTTPAEAARDIVLTLDVDIQQAAYDAIGDKVGSSVVIDPNNGEIIAMVSKPSYDPNMFILGITDEQWAQLNDPVKQPLINRAIQVGYPIGSTYKVVPAAAAMVHMGYNADTVLSCPGEFSLEGASQVWKDWIPGGQGELTLHNSLVRSCNTVFYRIGAELDKQNEMWLPDMSRGFGFGSPTGLPELEETAGIVPDPDWKMENVGDFWARGDAVNLAIGQGFFLASPLQLVDAYAALANGGTLYVPHLLLDVVALDGTIVQSGEVKERGKLPISAEQINVITEALYDVINASNGTATEAFQGINYQVSGKTGTAETGRQGEAAHAWFAAFTPSDAPKITVVTMIEHGVAGSQAAAPVARQIIDKWYVVNPQ
jgi:penicillin-binding protein 2